MKRCAVVGSPINHSLSPAMHRAAYVALGLDDWSYEAIDVDVDGLKGFIEGLDESWAGLSLTMPLKRAVMALADEAGDDAKALGVANTLTLGQRRLAANTDCPGAAAALVERGIGDVSTMRILGGGATASSVLHAVAQRPGMHIEFVVRDEQRATDSIDVAQRAGAIVTVRPFDAPLLDVVDLLVSTVPAKSVQKQSHELVDAARAVFDVVYNPWPTSLATAAQDHGKPFVSGIDLLAHQAAEQVHIFTGRRVDPQVLREAALAELERR